MSTIVRLLLFVVIGFVLAEVFHIRGLEHQQWYSLLTATLLAIGLYASTYGIVLTDARQNLRIILSAVTFGVLLKALVIGTALSLIFHDPFYFVFGVIVAQIDPLSVASLMGGDRMSPRAKAILASWASFDDPITVLLSLYVPTIVGQLSSTDIRPLEGVGSGGGLRGYVINLGINLVVVVGVFMLWKLSHKHLAKKQAFGVSAVVLGLFLLATTTLVVSIAYFLMLTVALSGLFLRPPIAKYVDAAVTISLLAATLLLGLLLVDGVAPVKGMALGIAAYGSQIVAAFLLTRRLPRKDRWHLALAQQNGITAIILGLLFETVHPGTIAVVGPALITINVLHAVANKILDHRTQLARVAG
jgi:NhaP-type Na+/H+ or K+/H+ antiporter